MARQGTVPPVPLGTLGTQDGASAYLPELIEGTSGIISQNVSGMSVPTGPLASELGPSTSMDCAVSVATGLLLRGDDLMKEADSPEQPSLEELSRIIMAATTAAQLYKRAEEILEAAANRNEQHHKNNNPKDRPGEAMGAQEPTQGKSKIPACNQKSTALTNTLKARAFSHLKAINFEYNAIEFKIKQSHDNYFNKNKIRDPASDVAALPQLSKAIQHHKPKNQHQNRKTQTPQTQERSNEINQATQNPIVLKQHLNREMRNPQTNRQQQEPEGQKIHQRISRTNIPQWQQGHINQTIQND